MHSPINLEVHPIEDARGSGLWRFRFWGLSRVARDPCKPLYRVVTVNLAQYRFERSQTASLMLPYFTYRWLPGNPSRGVAAFPGIYLGAGEQPDHTVKCGERSKCRQFHRQPPRHGVTLHFNSGRIPTAAEPGRSSLGRLTLRQIANINDQIPDHRIVGAARRLGRHLVLAVADNIEQLPIGGVCQRLRVGKVSHR